MHSEMVDLYDCFPVTRPEGARACLTGWFSHWGEVVCRKRSRPAVLILPGGGYEHTSLREAEPVALRFLAQGYVPFVLHYSCAPLTFPSSMREAAMAIKYIRQNARRFEINPEMVAVIGFSAGGHLCGCLGTMYDAPEVADIGSPAELRPDALGLCYPVAVSWGRTHEGTFQNITGGGGQLRKRLSLETLVRPDMPPVFLWHTRQDTAVPCRNSLLLAAALEEKGVSFVLHVYNKGIHGLSLANDLVYPEGSVPEVSRDVPTWPETMLEFFREQGFCIADEERSV